MNSTSTIAHQKTEQTENIESRIIEAAKQEFIKKGFEQTSTVSYTHLTLPTN